MASLAGDPTIRRQVMAAARDVLTADPGAPVETITRRAGVSRATFYRHFRSRDALLDSIAHERRPDARARVLAAAQDMLVRTSLSDLSMDELARASDVSRGTLYRLFPGKAALLEGLIAAYSPFEAVQRILHERRDDPPEVLLPEIARAVSGVAGERMGLLRAIFLEVTAGTEPAISGMRVAFGTAIGALTQYMAEQMAAGRIKPMHPILAVQALIGPILFHLLTRTALEQLAGVRIDLDDAVRELVAVQVRGLGR